MKTVTKLDEMRNKINDITDLEDAVAAMTTILGLSEIKNLEERIELLKSQLANKQQALFYFYASELDKEELQFAANTAKGRVRVMLEKHNRETGEGLTIEKIAENMTSNEGDATETPKPILGGLGGSFGGK